MSPVKMVKLISSTLKNEGIDLKEDNARSGGESQYKYPNLEAGTEALLTPVSSLVLVEYGLQHRYWEQFASDPMS